MGVVEMPTIASALLSQVNTGVTGCQRVRITNFFGIPGVRSHAFTSLHMLENNRLGPLMRFQT